LLDLNCRLLKLNRERRQLFEEANILSLLSEPEVYRKKKTYYRVWEHSIDGCWDGYGKEVRVRIGHTCKGAFKRRQEF
jgi:hypothetical protein